MTTFGQRLRAAREARGWTQEFVGLELDVTKASVSKWERDAAEPRLRHLGLLAALFTRTIDFLVVGERPDAYRVAEEGATYGRASEARAANANEILLLSIFRALPPPRQRALLDLFAATDQAKS